MKSALRYSNNSERVTVYEDGLIQESAVCSKPPLPVIEAEHRDWICIWDGVVGLNQKAP
jgi:hypothetical protein